MCDLERLRRGGHLHLGVHEGFLGDADIDELRERGVDVLLEVGAQGEGACHREDGLAQGAVAEQRAHRLDALAPVALGLDDLCCISYELIHAI